MDRGLVACEVGRLPRQDVVPSVVSRAHLQVWGRARGDFGLLAQGQVRVQEQEDSAPHAVRVRPQARPERAD